MKRRLVYISAGVFLLLVGIGFIYKKPYFAALFIISLGAYYIVFNRSLSKQFPKGWY
jgi:hypothetical protein